MTTTIEMPINDTMKLFNMGSEMAQLDGGYRKYSKKSKSKRSSVKRNSLKRKRSSLKLVKRKRSNPKFVKSKRSSLKSKKRSLKRKRNSLKRKLIQIGGNNLADIESMYSNENHPDIKMECPGSMTESGCGVLTNLAVLDQVFK